MSRVCLLGVGLAYLIGMFPASGIAQEAIGPTGSHALRALLNRAEIEPLYRVSDLRDRPSETLVIVLGDVHWPIRAYSRDHWSAFLRRGGRMLVAGDTPGPNQASFFTYCELDLTGERVYSDVRNYDNIKNLPLVDAFPRQDLCATARPLVTSNPSVLRVHPFSRGRIPLERLASYGLGARTEQRVMNPFNDLFAFGGDILGSGRVLLLADHSVFINQLMLRQDTGNLEFAQNCLRYLDPGQRIKKCLFVEDGEIITNFELRLTELPNAPPLPPPNVIVNTIVPHANKMVAEWQHRDLFNRTVLRGVTTAQLIRIVLGVITIFLVFYMLYRLRVAGRHTRRDQLMKHTFRPVVVGTGDSVTRRLSAQEDSRYWTDVARGVVRDWIESHAGSAASSVVVEGQGGNRLSREVDELREFAYRGSIPVGKGIGERAWRAMRARLLVLNRLADRGVWRFESEV